jgi:hypothetical protein
MVRGLSIAVAMLVGCVSAGVASGADFDPGTSREAPPTRAQVRAGIDHFLATHPGPVPLAAPSISRGTGGFGTGGGGGTQGGKHRLLPRHRVVSYWGAPGGSGILGRTTANGAHKRLARQARPYRRLGDEPVIRAFDLVATIATTCASRRDKCRIRQPRRLIRRYLNEVREFDGRLLLDIQPARSSFLDEVQHWRPFLAQPDVDLAIDPEWNVGRHGEPGETVGSTNADQVNALTRRLERIISTEHLPPKLLVIHQFRRSSVKRRDDIIRRDDVDITLNFDGIGAPAPKRRGYHRLSSTTLFDGFSLFYELDTDLMSPRQVLRLRPEPHYVMYQ